MEDAPLAWVAMKARGRLIAAGFGGFVPRAGLLGAAAVSALVEPLKGHRRKGLDSRRNIYFADGAMYGIAATVKELTWTGSGTRA